MPREFLPRRHLFKTIAPYYDFLADLFSLGLYARFLRKAIRILAPSQGEKVLDLCSGTGRAASWIAQSVGERGKAIGMDLAGDMVETARHRYGNRGNLIFLEQDVTQPWTLREPLDAVFTSFSIHELPGKGRIAALEQSYAVLKEGGRLVIADFNPGISGAGRIVTRIFFEIFERPNLDFLSFRQEESLREIGFKRIQTFPVLGSLLQVTLAEKTDFNGVR